MDVITFLVGNAECRIRNVEFQILHSAFFILHFRRLRSLFKTHDAITGSSTPLNKQGFAEGVDGKVNEPPAKVTVLGGKINCQFL